MDKAKSLNDECLIYLPKNYTSDKGWPLVLYLHGSGDRGCDSNLVRKNGLPRHLNDGESYPAVVAAPQCREESYWRPEDLAELIDYLIDQFAIDEDRIYVLGESMGGYGTWSLASYAPTKLAAVVPLCGGGDISTAGKMIGLPIWAFHGEVDDVISLNVSKEMVDAVVTVGGKARLTVLTGRGHDIRDVAWKNEELLDWMLSQRRQLESPGP